MDFLRKIFPVAALVAIACAPSQFAIDVFGVHVALGELLLLPAFALGLIARRLARPPAECLALVVLVAISSAFATKKERGRTASAAAARNKTECFIGVKAVFSSGQEVSRAVRGI